MFSQISTQKSQKSSNVIPTQSAVLTYKQSPDTVSTQTVVRRRQKAMALTHTQATPLTHQESPNILSAQAVRQWHQESPPIRRTARMRVDSDESYVANSHEEEDDDDFNYDDTYSDEDDLSETVRKKVTTKKQRGLVSTANPLHFSTTRKLTQQLTFESGVDEHSQKTPNEESEEENGFLWSNKRKRQDALTVERTKQTKTVEGSTEESIKG